MKIKKIGIQTDEEATFEHFLGMVYRAARRKLHAGTETEDDDAILWAVNKMSHMKAELRKLKGAGAADDQDVAALEKERERANVL